MEEEHKIVIFNKNYTESNKYGLLRDITKIFVSMIKKKIKSSFKLVIVKTNKDE